MEKGFEQSVLNRERELDEKEGRKRLDYWVRAGNSWQTYPTGYNGKKLGDLTTIERLDLAELHQRERDRHEWHVASYRHYASGDPEAPAAIGL